MKKKTILTISLGVLTLSVLGFAATKTGQPELEMKTFGAQIDQIMSKTTIIADVEVKEEKL